MPWVPEQPGVSILTYLLWGSLCCHFDICMTYVYVVFYLYMHHYFERCGYTNYLWLGNGDIRSIYLFLFQFPSVIFLGYDVPAYGSRVPFVYICVCLITVSIYGLVGYFMIGDVVGEIYTAIYTYHWWMGLAGSRHLEYLYVLIVDFFHSAPRPYIRTGWSVVRQIDGPCQFFCRNHNPIWS